MTKVINKKIISILMAVLFIVSTVIIPVSAEETVSESTFEHLSVEYLDKVDAIGTRAAEDPERLFDLVSGNVYTAIISQLAVGWGTKTRFYFNTTGSIYLHYNLNNIDSERVLVFELYENTTSAWKLAQTKKITFSGSTNGTVQFYGLDKNKNYFIRFYNATPRIYPWESKDINGDVKISNTQV